MKPIDPSTFHRAESYAFARLAMVLVFLTLLVIFMSAASVVPDRAAIFWSGTGMVLSALAAGAGFVALRFVDRAGVAMLNRHSVLDEFDEAQRADAAMFAGLALFAAAILCAIVATIALL